MAPQRLRKLCHGAFSPAILLDLQTNLIKPETRDTVPCSRKLKLDARATRCLFFFFSSSFSLSPPPPLLSLPFFQFFYTAKHLYIISSSSHYIAWCFTQFHRFCDPFLYARRACSRCRYYGNLNWKFLCACLQSLCAVITYESNHFSRLSYIFPFSYIPSRRHRIYFVYS